MRAVLINPPFDYFPTGSGRWISYARPPLGIAYLAAALRRDLPGVEVTLMDEIVHRHEPDELLRIVAGLRPDLVGVSTVTPTVDTALRIAQGLRPLLPDALLVAGGPHSTVRPGDLLQSFDAAVVGEGEQTIVELARRHLAGEALEGTPGAALLREGETICEPGGFIEPMDSIPFPARDLLPQQRYFHSYPYRVPRGIFTTQFTSRGCPFNCAFCGSHTLWGKLRTFSLDYVKAEIDHVVQEHGASLVFFDDDHFTADAQRALEICEHLERYGKRLRWICHSHLTALKPQMLEAMRRAGCVEIQVGVESGDDEILKSMGRPYKSSQVREVFADARKAGINLWATYILGFPGETRRTIRSTLDLALQTNPAYASFIVLLPFPGARVFDRMVSQGYLLHQDWKRYSWHFSPVFSLPDLSADDLVTERARCMRKFYLRPRKLAQIAWHVLHAGRMREMLRNFLAWASLALRSKRLMSGR
ncbi:MAG: radical SAM protein [Candidatus Alcyoniella australis]|nr:radical SAM protein [Candidatus Alcyoniella australis]